MIIDAHVHLGEDVVFDEVNTEEELIKYYDEFEVLFSHLFRDRIWKTIERFMTESQNFVKNSGRERNFLEWLPSIRISIEKIIMMKQNTA